MVPVEVPTPEHVVVVSPTDSACILMQEPAKCRLCLGMGARIVDVEYGECAIQALYLYGCDVISIGNFDNLPGLSIDFSVDPDCRANHCPFLPSIGWVDLVEMHWCPYRVELCDVGLLEEHYVPLHA